MRNKIILFAVAFLLMMNLASAVVSFYQEDIELLDNAHITRTANSVFWSRGALSLSGESSFWDFLFPADPPTTVKDIITSDELLEVEIDYSMYPRTWNERSSEYEIENCTLTVNYFENKLNQSYIFYEETVTKYEADIKSKKYFVRIPEKDGISVFMDCYFVNESRRILDTPTELQIKLPTHECKACQYYEWNVQQRDVLKAQTIGGNTVSVIEFIKEFVVLNFELILAGFWAFLILMLFVGISLMFLGVYWLFIFFRKLLKEI